MNLGISTALVTGSASGLGRATVEGLLERGCNVVAGDVVTQPEIQGSDALSAGHRRVHCDVTETASVDNALNVAVEEFGRIDFVVNCAGVYGAGRLVNRRGEPIDLREFTRVVDVNLTGAINVFRLAAARMARQEPRDGERGVAISVSSIAGIDGQLGHAAYVASKAALSEVTYTLALDLAPHLIRVLSIAPGPFETKMLGDLGDSAHDEVVAHAKHPARVGEPHEFASLAVHIAENQMLNGTTFRIDAATRFGG